MKTKVWIPVLALFSLFHAQMGGILAQSNFTGGTASTSAGGSSRSPNGQTEQQAYSVGRSDQSITADVRTSLEADSVVDASKLTVRTATGKVQLRGQVDSLLAKERAAEIAAAIPGVQNVESDLIVHPAQRTDLEIQRSIQRAFQWDSAVENYELQVAVEQGIAILRGTVDSLAEKQLALELAKSIRGVKRIEDEIAVNPKPNRLDTDVAYDIRSILRSDPQLRGPGIISVEVRNGIVNLSGKLTSLRQASRAIQDAEVAGVKAIRTTDLEVNPNALAAAKKGGMVHPVIELSQPILEPTGRMNTNLGGSTGNDKETVPSAEPSGASNSIRPPPAGEIIPDVHPSSPAARPTDQNLRTEVNRRISSQPALGGSNIEVKVEGGEVTLLGTVHSSEDSRRAEAAAYQAGAIKVMNRLTISP